MHTSHRCQSPDVYKFSFFPSQSIHLSIYLTFDKKNKESFHYSSHCFYFLWPSFFIPLPIKKETLFLSSFFLYLSLNLGPLIFKSGIPDTCKTSIYKIYFWKLFFFHRDSTGRIFGAILAKNIFSPNLTSFPF